MFLDNSAIVFSDRCDHKYMANGRPVKSAGFCSIETKRNQFDDVVLSYCSCYGQSTSLGVKADPCDSEIVQEIFRGMH